MTYIGVLLGVEMTVALLSMVPAARVGDALGQKPVVAFGFFVYAVFPVLLIFSPSHPGFLILLFAFSGLRYAGMPSHKALIVGPAREQQGATTTGVYYLIRNTLRMPAPALGGYLYSSSPPFPSRSRPVWAWLVSRTSSFGENNSSPIQPSRKQHPDEPRPRTLLLRSDTPNPSISLPLIID